MDFVKDMKSDSKPGNSVEGSADNAVNQGTLPRTHSKSFPTRNDIANTAK